MKSVMVDLLEGFVWLAVVVFIVLGGSSGFVLGMGAFHNNYPVILGLAMAGAVVGLCVSALLCGPMIVLLQMRDALQEIRSKTIDS